MRPRVVFLHGVGGGVDAAGWLNRLNANLVDLGTDPLDRDSVLSPDYGPQFGMAHPVTPPMPLRWKKGNNYEAARSEFVLRRAELSAELAAYSRSTGTVLNMTTDGGLLMNLPPFAHAKAYVSAPELRNAIWAHLASQIPSD